MNKLSPRDQEQVFEDSLQRFWNATSPLLMAALIIHGMLLVLFALLEQWMMAATNLLSVSIYLYLPSLIRQRRYRAASLFMTGEILAHAAMATWCLGWESNFHYYVLCTLPVIVNNFRTAPLRHLLLLAGISGVLIIGYLKHDLAAPPGTSLTVLGVLNLVIALALLLTGTASSVHHSLQTQFKLAYWASHDSLTNLYNRRRLLACTAGLDERLGTLILLDVDHFKKVNDRFGHERGDLILRHVAEVIRAEIREGDLAARWGGEEFLVLLPATGLEGAERVAHRIHQRIVALVAELENRPEQLSATLAVCEIQPGEGFERALERADRALYEGKREGRDRVKRAA